jgi:hypothetical protein
MNVRWVETDAGTEGIDGSSRQNDRRQILRAEGGVQGRVRANDVLGDPGRGPGVQRLGRGGGVIGRPPVPVLPSPRSSLYIKFQASSAAPIAADVVAHAAFVLNHLAPVNADPSLPPPATMNSTYYIRLHQSNEIRPNNTLVLSLVQVSYLLPHAQPLSR